MQRKPVPRTRGGRRHDGCWVHRPDRAELHDHARSRSHGASAVHVRVGYHREPCAGHTRPLRDSRCPGLVCRRGDRELTELSTHEKPRFAMNEMHRSETVLTTFTSGFSAGPAASFVASPTVSPTIAALCAGDRLPPL